MLVLTAGLILYLGRSTSFYFDEWNFVLDRRAWDARALLMPHNEHLSVVPVLVYKLLFSTVGIDAYAPYRVAGLIVHLIVLVLLFVYARRRVGDLLALGATVIVAVLGPAWPDVMWPFQMGFLGSLAAGIGALLCLDRGDRRGEIGASVLLTVALASSSLGIPLFIAAAIEILGRPDRRARWKILIAPAVLYALWWLGYHSSNNMESVDNLLSTPAYVAEAAAAAMGSLFGLPIEWGRPLVLFFIVAIGLVVRRAPVDLWRLIALISLPLVFWALTGLARADLHEPGAPRYLYPGVVFILLIAVEAARGVRVSHGALVVLAGAAGRHHAVQRRHAAQRRRLPARPDRRPRRLARGAAAGGAAPRRPAVPPAGDRRTAGLRRHLPRGGRRARLPSAAAVLAAAAARPQPRDGRRHAPGGLRARARARRGQAGRRGAEGRERNGTRTSTKGSCLVDEAGGAGSATLDLTVPTGGIEIDGGAKVFLRRFGDQYPVGPVGASTAGAPVALRIPSDASSAPWHARSSLDGPRRASAGLANVNGGWVGAGLGPPRRPRMSPRWRIPPSR